jgi:hypothetical protein
VHGSRLPPGTGLHGAWANVTDKGHAHSMNRAIAKNEVLTILFFITLFSHYDGSLGIFNFAEINDFWSMYIKI